MVLRLSFISRHGLSGPCPSASAMSKFSINVTRLGLDGIR